MINAVGICKVLWKFTRGKHDIILRKSEKHLTFDICPSRKYGLTSQMGKNTRVLGEGNSVSKHRGSTKYRLPTGVLEWKVGVL